jgi:endonuclease/exonuclease/phosphatase family metal-dependent hydrolase
MAVVVALAVPGPARAAPGPGVLGTLAGPPAAADLDVMTFNLRYAATGTPNSWAQRRPVMRELLSAEAPHLIGTQEGLAAQLRDIEAGLGARYDVIGQGREGGTRGEHMAVFYDNTRLTALEHRHFWLSDTPEVAGSNTWGGGSIRMVTWVRFADLRTGGQFYVANTHLDNVSGYARERAAGLIRERLAALQPGLPVILTGDVNSAAAPGNAPFDILTGAGYADSWTAAAVRGPAIGTFHNYRPLVADGPRIDWVLTTPGVTVRAAAVNTHRGASGQYPSDHLPVQARLTLPVL